MVARRLADAYGPASHLLAFTRSRGATAAAPAIVTVAAALAFLGPATLAGAASWGAPWSRAASDGR
jgi:hypothetical protein